MDEGVRRRLDGEYWRQYEIIRHQYPGHAWTGYEIRYAINKKFKSAKKITTKKTTYTLKKLKKGKTYYVKVRSYRKVGKWTMIYSDYCKPVKIKVKK